MFVKGASPLAPTDANRLWRSQRFAMSVARTAAPEKVTTLAGEARLAFHGVDPVIAGSSQRVPGGGRINLTLRRAAP